MPHIIIEHSNDLTEESALKLGQKIQEIMASTNAFDPDQCKVRNQIFNKYLVGKIDENSSSFIHVTIKVLFGRSLEIRQEVAQNSLAHLKNLAQDLKFNSQRRFDLSVDIQEMEPQTYQKLRL